MKISDVTSTRGYTYKYDIPYYPYFWYIFRELIPYLTTGKAYANVLV